MPGGFIRHFQGIDKVKTTFIIILRHYFPVYCVDICSNDASAMLAKIAGVLTRGSK